MFGILSTYDILILHYSSMCMSRLLVTIHSFIIRFSSLYFHCFSRLPLSWCLVQAVVVFFGLRESDNITCKVISPSKQNLKLKQSWFLAWYSSHNRKKKWFNFFFNNINGKFIWYKYMILKPILLLNHNSKVVLFSSSVSELCCVGAQVVCV